MTSLAWLMARLNLGALLQKQKNPVVKGCRLWVLFFLVYDVDTCIWVTMCTKDSKRIYFLDFYFVSDYPYKNVTKFNMTQLLLFALCHNYGYVDLSDRFLIPVIPLQTAQGICASMTSFSGTKVVGCLCHPCSTVGMHHIKCYRLSLIFAESKVSFRRWHNTIVNQLWSL